MEHAPILLLRMNHVEHMADLLSAQFGVTTLQGLGGLEDHQVRVMRVRRRERERLAVAITMARLNFTVFTTAQEIPHGPNQLLDAPASPHCFRVYSTDGSSRETIGQASVANIEQGPDGEPFPISASLWIMRRVSTLTAELVGLLKLLRWIRDQRMERGSEHLVCTDSRASVNLWGGRTPGEDWLVPIWSLILEVKRQLEEDGQVVYAEWRRRRDTLVKAADQAARRAFTAPANELHPLQGDIVAAMVHASRLYRDPHRVGPPQQH